MGIGLWLRMAYWGSFRPQSLFDLPLFLHEILFFKQEPLLEFFHLAVVWGYLVNQNGIRQFIAHGFELLRKFVDFLLNHRL